LTISDLQFTIAVDFSIGSFLGGSENMKVRMYFVLLAVVLAAPRVSLARVLFGQNYTSLSYLYYDYGDGDKSYFD
jgi:hypothetical protein